jgi:flavin-dependent dehydrogenase
VGDAAGLSNPITGAGIPAAIHSGTLAGTAVRGWFAGDGDALADYEDELTDLYQASLERACLRRAELLAQYGNGGQPDAAALRRSWIAYDAYWAA